MYLGYECAVLLVDCVPAAHDVQWQVAADVPCMSAEYKSLQIGNELFCGIYKGKTLVDPLRDARAP